MESASLLVTPPAKAKADIFADNAAVTPETLSSTTAHRSGVASICAAANRFSRGDSRTFCND